MCRLDDARCEYSRITTRKFKKFSEQAWSSLGIASAPGGTGHLSGCNRHWTNVRNACTIPNIVYLDIEFGEHMAIFQSRGHEQVSTSVLGRQGIEISDRGFVALDLDREGPFDGLAALHSACLDVVGVGIVRRQFRRIVVPFSACPGRGLPQQLVLVSRQRPSPDRSSRADSVSPPLPIRPPGKYNEP